MSRPRATKHTLVANFLILGVGQGLGLLLGLVTAAILARHLGRDGYGAYTTAFVFLTVYSSMIGLAMPSAMQLQVGRDEEREREIVSGVLGLRVLTAAVGFALAPLAVIAFGYGTTVNEAVLFGAAGFFCTLVVSTLGAVFQIHLATVRIALARVFNRLAFLTLASAVAWLGYEVSAMMGAFTLANIAFLGVVAWMSRSLVTARPRFDAAVWKETLDVGWSVWLVSFLGVLYLRSDIFVLAWFRPEAEVGVYGLAYRFIILTNTIPMMLINLLLPQLTRAWHQQDEAAFSGYLQGSFDLFVIVLLPIVVGSQLLATELCVFVAGAEFAQSGDILPILIASSCATFFSYLYRTACVATGSQRRLIWRSIVTTIAALSAFLVLIPSYGMMGAAWTTVGAECLMVTLTFGATYGACKHVPRLTVLWKAGVSVIAMYLALRWLPAMHVLVDVAVGAAVYSGALFATGALRSGTLRKIAGGLRRGGS